MGTQGLLAALAAAALLTGCGGSSTSVVSHVNAGASTVTVTNSGAAVQSLTVTLSTGISGVSPSGTLTSAVTSQAGTVTFPALPAAGQLCVSATLGGQFLWRCPYPFPANVTLAFGS